MNHSDIGERFAKLELENEMLRAEVDALKPKAPAPRPPIEPVVKISYPIAASTFIMPSDDELDSLREIVCGKYPSLGDARGLVWRGSREENEIEYFLTFKLAFLALGNVRRLENPDRKRYFTHWTDHCEDFLRSIGKPYTLRFAPFMAAVLAHGDVPYSGFGMQHEGAIVEIGLSEYIGRQASDVPWKHVLETGELLPMSPVRVPLAPPSPARVVVGNHSW